MTALLYNTDLRFSLTFKVATKKIRFTDLLSGVYASSYGLTVGNCKGIINVTGSVSGVVYQNVNWVAGTYGTPDIDGNAATWYVEFDQPDDVDGVIIPQEFTVEYKLSTSAILGQTVLAAPEKSYVYGYVSPTVIPSLTHVCRTALISAIDDTSTDYLFGDIVPVIARIKSVTEPAGTTRTPAGHLDSTTLADTAWAIGGTTSPTTSLWSGVWQLNISTGLTYSVEAWGSYTWIVITDTVTGYKTQNVQCTDCACLLNQCITNFFDYTVGLRDTNPAKYQEYREKSIEILMLWMQFTNAERCGEEYDTFCTEIQDIVKGTDCFCLQDLTTSPVPIYPISSSTVTQSATFLFDLITSLPGGTPAWDWAFLWDNVTVPSASTYLKLYQNVGGTAFFVMDIKGAAGAAGAAGRDGTGTNQSVLWNDIGNSGTAAGTSETTLKTYTLPSGILENNGEQLEIDTVSTLAANDNGKTVRLYFGGNEIYEYFTDSLIISGDDKLYLGAVVNRTAVAAQYVTSKAERGNKMYSPKVTTWTENSAAPIIIHLSGQNSTSTANDIVANQLCLRYSGMVSSTPVISADLKFGILSLTAGVQYDYLFATDGWANFTSTPYTLNLTAVDVNGDTQQVTIVGTPAVTGFSISTIVNTTVSWSAFL
jgi:hypothetical protein